MGLVFAVQRLLLPTLVPNDQALFSVLPCDPGGSITAISNLLCLSKDTFRKGELDSRIPRTVELEDEAVAGCLIVC